MSHSDIHGQMHPGAAKMLEILAEAKRQGTPGLHQVSPAVAREMNLRSKELFGSTGPDMSTAALTLPMRDGKAIAARLYRPLPSAEPLPRGLPVVVYYHGGGWVIGSLETHDGVCRHLAARSGAAVLSVDYRLAPEAKFPVAVQDSYDALVWLFENGTALGLDVSRIVVSGDSAGGNLAAAVALLARDNDGPAIALQALLYPATNMHTTSASHAEFTQHLLTPQAVEWFQQHYLRDAADKDDWRASPLLAEDLSGLAPAYVMTAGFDPLRDEGKAYAEALQANGVDVTYQNFAGQIHGFLTLDGLIAEAIDAIDATALQVRRACFAAD
jgi:acetyl esterase